jgi:hypothetical protein
MCSASMGIVRERGLRFSTLLRPSSAIVSDQMSYRQSPTRISKQQGTSDALICDSDLTDSVAPELAGRRRALRPTGDDGCCQGEKHRRPGSKRARLSNRLVAPNRSEQSDSPRQVSDDSSDIGKGRAHDDLLVAAAVESLPHQLRGARTSVGEVFE